VELALDTAEAEGVGGYARAEDEAFYERQRALMGRVVRESDVVITTAVVPGQRAPVLITADMVQRMPPGSVIVDLAAERGGNCELTRADETVVAGWVTIFGPVNLAGRVPHHASQMYARNVTALLLHLVERGQLRLDPADPIARETLLTRGGEVVHPRVREALGLPPLAPVAAGA
jgi:NAD(P) transhydrogenase subunit alpha